MRKANFWLILALGVGGCTPAPKAVYVDLKSVELDAPLEIADTVVSMDSGEEFSATFAELDEVRLYDGISQADEDKIQAALVKTRTDAFNRALESLRQQYQSQVEAERAVASQAAQQADKTDWAATTDDLREIFEKYAEDEGRLRIRIEALDRAKRRPSAIKDLRRELEDQMRVEIDEKVVNWKKELAFLESQFEAEISPILAAFKARKATRENVADQIASELTAQFEAEALQQARQIVDTTFAEVIDFDAVIKETLPGVAGTSVKFQGVKGGKKALEGVKASSIEDLEFQAKLFAESNNYELVGARPGVRNATKEFIEWRKRFEAGR